MSTLSRLGRGLLTVVISDIDDQARTLLTGTADGQHVQPPENRAYGYGGEK